MKAESAREISLYTSCSLVSVGDMEHTTCVTGCVVLFRRIFVTELDGLSGAHNDGAEPNQPAKLTQAIHLVLSKFENLPCRCFESFIRHDSGAMDSDSRLDSNQPNGVVDQQSLSDC